MIRYIVVDTKGDPRGIPFKEELEAEIYRNIFGSYDWKIRKTDIRIMRKSTERQRRAVSFCEKWLDLRFDGDMNDFYDCSSFLEDNLDDAKMRALELECEYNSRFI